MNSIGRVVEKPRQGLHARDIGGKLIDRRPGWRAVMPSKAAALKDD
jgi:hypothetical protein